MYKKRKNKQRQSESRHEIKERGINRKKRREIGQKIKK